MRIYVASSWRNARQPQVVRDLRGNGFEVYDFRNPREGDGGFHWSDIDPEWRSWAPEQFREKVLNHPLAARGFDTDMDALRSCHGTLLVMPCGRSAHLELGWSIGAGRPTAILLDTGEPELMYRMTRLCVTVEEVIQLFRGWYESHPLDINPDTGRNCFGNLA